MRILAIDTSTEWCSAALWDGQAMLSDHRLAGQKHSEWLLPMVQELLATAQVGLHDLDGIAYGAGPGAFTGLRIASGVAQGLALGADLPALGVSTLECLAEMSGGNRAISCLDARMNEVYLAAYQRQASGWEEVVAPLLARPDAVPGFDPPLWQLIGNGFGRYPDLAARLPGQLLPENAQATPRADVMAQLALPRFARGEGQDAALIAPLYIRNKVALKISEREKA